MTADPVQFSSEWTAATRAQWESGKVHDADFLAFSTFPFFSRCVRIIMDVGANRGQSIASFNAMLPAAIIHAFEANPAYASVLRIIAGYRPGKINVYNYGLGRSNEILEFFLPFARGIPFPEEASTRRDYFDRPWVQQKFEQRGGLTLQTMRVKVRRGDDLGLLPDVIKIDVEGAEADVLAGLDETIRTALPVLLIENSDWHNVTGFLAERSYKPFRFMEQEGELVPYFGETANAFYLPDSRVDQIFAK